MVVAGAPERRPDHAEAMAAMALDIKESSPSSRARAARPRLPHWDPLRPGGRRRDRQEEVFLRHVGRQREHAARMESHGIPGEIQVSARVRDLLSDSFLFVERWIGRA